MTDLAVTVDHAHGLNGAEGPVVEVEGGGGVLAAQVRRELAHGSRLSVERLHEGPDVSFHVDGVVLAVAVRLVDRLIDDLSALFLSVPEVSVDVVDHDRHAGGDGPERAWRCHPPLRRLRVEPNDTIARLQFAVDDSTVGVPREFARAEAEHAHEVLEGGLEV